MPSYLDLALLAIVTVSALLSMVRGLTREVLAIASWAAAAVAAYALYPLVLPYIKPYVAKDTVAIVLAVATVFFLTLIIVSIITVKLSEAILDSRVGALDRTLGFVFGAARGFLLGVVAFLFFNWLVPTKSQPEWVARARSKPLLQATGDTLVAMLPQDPESTIFKNFRKEKPPASEDSPADTDTTLPPVTGATPGRKTEAAPPTTAVPEADRQRLDTLAGRAGGPTQSKPVEKKP